MSKIITQGIIASPGIRIGKAFVYHGTAVITPKYHIGEHEVPHELDRFSQALEKTKAEIAEIQDEITRSLSRDMADIFSSHLMVLEDPQMVEKIRAGIRNERRNAEWVISDLSIELINTLSAVKDEYIRERIVDIADINKRLIANLQKTEHASLNGFDGDVIVFAQDLTPSETALMDRNRILAIVTDRGGRTSHTAIMARAMEIPAIVGTVNATHQVHDGDTVIVDAVHGKIIIEPTEEEIAEYRREEQHFRAIELELAKLTDLPARTLDGVDVAIYGNIEIPDEMTIIKGHGAQGIGLFRSEFLFLDRPLPDEDTQFNAYRKVVEFFNPMPVTIRTIDVGADKIHGYVSHHRERNPFLGCRAIRFSLEHEDLFRVQLRAILRASAYGNVRLMFPMITTVEEFLKARAITSRVMDELKREGTPFDEKIQIGIMIEVPSAVVCADILAKYADFFSVGTNDLVQYLLAVDRISETIAYLYNPLNLSVLRFLRQIVRTAAEASIPLSICGEIAGEPQYTMTLLGLGFRNFSMSPINMFMVKKIIRSVTIEECERMVDRLFRYETTHEIENEVRRIFRDKALDTPQ